MKIKEKIVLTAVITVIIILVSCNVYLVEEAKIEAARQAEEDAKKEIEMLEEIRSAEAREIAEFDRDYKALKDEFTVVVDELSEKLNSQISNINELKEITQQRMDTSKKLKEDLSRMYIPAPLKDYYKYDMKFLESDIVTAAQVLLYYKSDTYSTFDDAEIDGAYRERSYWLREAEAEKERVYGQYKLEYLLES
jgi:DNA repair exonuclease SbcCD ATPase subunit